MEVRVPADCPDLATALTLGATRVVLSGEVPADVLLDRPVEIVGGTLVGRSGRALVISADVVIRGVNVRNPAGNGVLVLGGSPVLDDMTIRVAGVGLGLAGTSAARITNVRVEVSKHALLIAGDANPTLVDCVLLGESGGVVIQDRALGHLDRVGVASGDHAAIEIRGEARPSLEGCAIAKAATGGLYVHGKARPRVKGLVMQDVGGVGIEVSGHAAPVLDGAHVMGCGSAGVVLHGDSRARVSTLRIDGAGRAGLEIADRARPVVDGLMVSGSGGDGLLIHDSAGGTLMDVQISSSGQAGIEVRGDASVELESVRVEGGGNVGVWLRGACSVEILGLNVGRQRMIALKVDDDARAYVEDAVLHDNREDGLMVSGAAEVDLVRSQLDGNDGVGVVVGGKSVVRWQNGGAAGNRSGDVRVLSRARLATRDVTLGTPAFVEDDAASTRLVDDIAR